MAEKKVPQQLIDAANSDIVRVIGSYIKLTKERAEYVACCPFHHEKTPSFKVNPKKGLFHCFGCGANGDAVGFVMQHTKCTFPEAVEAIEGKLPDAPTETRKADDDLPTWEAQDSVPDDAPEPNFKHYKLGRPSAVWTYTTADGRLVGYVCRFETVNDDGSRGKETIPITWAHNRKTDEFSWRWLSFKTPRPLYGMDLLASRPAAKVLVVEGEKTADAARKIFPTFVVVSWPGGGNAVHKANWSALAGREVIYWPDFDWQPYKEPHPDAGKTMPVHMQPGVRAVRDIHKLIAGTVASARIVPPTEGCPSGWDLADASWSDDFEPVSYAKARITDASEWFGRQLQQAVNDNLPTAPTTPAPSAPASPAPLDVHSVDTYSPLFDTNDRGTPLSTIENLREILRRLSTTVRYNVIAKRMEILIPGASFSVDNNANASLAHITSWANRFRMPTGNIGDYLLALSDANPYNPVANWVMSREWDGTSRIQAFFDTVREVEVKRLPDGRSLKEALMMRWLLSAVAAAFEPNGISSAGMLVLQGAQYAGKTKWLKKLAPAELNIIKDGMILDPSNKDSVKLCVSHWIVELGELDATFRKADIANLKAFLTLDCDKLRLPYARAESEFARRTVFFASVNPRNFLHDPTGNRRFWTVECASIDHEHTLDMQQVWAEVYHTYKAGYKWWLDQDEFMALNEHNMDYTSSDPVHDLIDSGFDWRMTPDKWCWRMTATDICIAAGIQKPTKQDINSASNYVVNKYKVRTVKSNAKFWMMPQRAFKYDNRPPDPAHPAYDGPH